MYFRKILGKKARSIKRHRMLQGRAIALDLLAYLADKRKYDEALNVSQVSYVAGVAVEVHEQWCALSR